MSSKPLWQTPAEILGLDRMPTAPMIAEHIVMKLPKEGSLPAAPAAVDVAAVILSPAAIEPSGTSVFGTTGDSSPVIFGPAIVRAAAPPYSIHGGKPPIAPAALMGAAGCALNNFQRNLLISLFFCRSSREVGFVSALESRREHQEECLLNTAAFGPWWPRLDSANYPIHRKTAPPSICRRINEFRHDGYSKANSISVTADRCRIELRRRSHGRSL
jgi:hypothetical protein